MLPRSACVFVQICPHKLSLKPSQKMNSYGVVVLVLFVLLVDIGLVAGDDLPTCLPVSRSAVVVFIIFLFIFIFIHDHLVLSFSTIGFGYLQMKSDVDLNVLVLENCNRSLKLSRITTRLILG